MTQDSILKTYIADFEKVCKVSNVISQTCQIRGYDWLEKTLLNKWLKMVLDYQEKGEEVAFLFAKWHFIDYMRTDSLMEGDSIREFLIDTIKAI